jgi:3-methyladenine DNA glycosylase AlkD
MLSSLVQLRADLRRHARPAKASFLPGFFRAAKGGYGEGDRFLGVIVPDTRRIARTHREAAHPVLASLLASPWHEERLLALLILEIQMKRAPDQATRGRLARFFLKHRSGVNNWDLVDSSASQLLGAWLEGEPRVRRSLLDRLAGSHSVWERRIAMVATHRFIRAGESADCVRIARRLLRDDHDLIHKASGWMLREMGLRVPHALRAFLDRHAHEMPRTMLRYALERVPLAERRRYMQAKALKARGAG